MLMLRSLPCSSSLSSQRIWGYSFPLCLCLLFVSLSISGWFSDSDPYELHLYHAFLLFLIGKLKLIKSCWPFLLILNYSSSEKIEFLHTVCVCSLSHLVCVCSHTGCLIRWFNIWFNARLCIIKYIHCYYLLSNTSQMSCLHHSTFAQVFLYTKDHKYPVELSVA